jgi:flagellar motility protein MotE (MotC chaperone)
LNLVNTLNNRPPRPRDLRAQDLRAQDLRASMGRSSESSSTFGPSPVVRLLPIVIVAAVFMLGFRIQIVVQDIAHTRTTTVKVEQATALAQAAAPAPAAPQTPAQPAAGAPATPPVAAGEPSATAPAEGAAGTAVTFDPSTLSKTEIEVLQRLSERRSTVEKHEREVEAKDGLLKAAEARIDGKIAQLQDLEKNIKGLLSQYDGQKQQEIEQLVRIYSAMKPQEASKIFETLDMPILLALVQKMKEAKVAPIMAQMTPAKATALTEAITSRKQLSSAP